MKNKRLLVLVNGNYVSGTERMTIEILKGLKDSGNSIYCIVSGWNDGNFIKHLRMLGIEYTVTKLGWYYLSQLKWSLDSLVHYPGAVSQFLKTGKKFQYDYIYVTSFRQIVLLYPFLKNNIIYHVHDTNAKKRQSRLFLKRVDKKIVKYIAVSNYVKDDLAICGINPEKIEVIYNGIKKQPVIDRVKEDRFTIGIVGQVLPTKGHNMVLEALKILRERGCNVQLYIVGSGNEKFINDLEQKIKLYNLEEYVSWKGYKDTLSEIYAGIDVVVAPSTRIEGFGLMACEANMFSIPAVVTNTGGQAEIIENGFNGFVVDPLDPVDIADKLQLFYNDPELVNSMGKNGRQRVIEKFSLEQMNIHFQTLIQNLG